MREQEIELLNRIIYLNTMGASPQLIEAQESLAFEILQREQLGIVSSDFLENPIVNSFIRSKYNDTQNNSYHFQQPVETFGDDLFPCDNDLEDYISYDMQEPINSLTESNTLSTTISRSNREQEIELLNPILSLNAMESNHKIDDLISNFKSVLSSRRKPYAIKAMWDENPSLQAWYSGQPVNFGNNQSQQPRVITLDNLINSFKSALSNQTPYIIKAMWDGNPLLRAWYSGQPVNFGNNQSQQPDMRTISLDDLISNFKCALSSQTPYVIKAMWDGNSLLRAWYRGQPVNFGNNQSQQPDMRTLSLNELISNFKSVLSSHTAYVIKAMWDENPLLRAWYSGQPINFGNDQFQQPDMHTISFDELISNFKSALSSHTTYVIKAMWYETPLLRAWYSGQPVNFGNNQSQQPDIRAISLDDLISNFKSVLASRCEDVIKAMWDGNPLLRACYSGQPVNFGNNQSQQPDIRAISLDDLISNFKSILSSQMPYVTKAMWDGNDILHNAIKRLDPEQSKSLLEKVITSNRQGKSDFITEYVNWLDDAGTIRAVLEEIQTSCGNKKLSYYKANQIGVLQNRLEIPDASQQDSVTHPSDTLITTNNSNQLTVPTPTNRSKKRKVLSEAESSRGKKQRTEVIESELSNLVKQMPSLLSRQTHFCVEQAVGQNLQKLSKTTKDELGIGSIRKVRNKTQYKVEISDLSKYRDAYNKYTAPLFVTAANTNNPLSSQNQSTDVQSFSPQEEQRNNSENQPLINAAAEISHVTTDFIQTNELDAMEQKIKDMDDLINNFKSALSNQKSSVINDMWNKNSLLRARYSGQPVDFGNNQYQQMRAISLDDLFSNFKLVLSSQKTAHVLKTMWDGNKRLHDAIKSLDLAQSKSLLNRVMASCKDGKSKFITEYVNWLDDTSTIRAVLEKIQMGYRRKPSTYKANQIGVLQKRLDEIRDASQQGQNQSTDAQSFSPQEEQRNNSENQPLINAAAKTSHVTTAVLLEAEENTLDFIPNRLIHPEQSSQNNSYHFQQSEETLDDDLFLFDNNLEDDTSFNMLEPINPQTESTSPTTILRSDTTTYRSQTTSSPTLFGHQFNTQTINTFVACHTNTSTEEIIDLTKEKEPIIKLQDAPNTQNYSEQLLEYVQKGDDVRIKRIDDLLASGSDINYQDSAGFSPLMYAVDSNNERIAEYVLNCGANPFLKNKSGNTAKTLTSRNLGIYKIIKGYELLAHTSAGNLSGIKSLLNADNSIIDFQRRDGYTPLLIATELGLTEIVDYLLSRRPNLEITLNDGKGIFDLSVIKL